MKTPTELLALCMELNKPDFPVFFNYAGHAEPFYFPLNIIPGGYPGEAVYFQHLFTVEDIQKAMKWLTEQHDKYRSTQNEVDGNAD